MVWVCLLCPDGVSPPAWVTEELRTCGFSFEVASLSQPKALPPASLFVVLGNSLWTEDEGTALAVQLGVNPLAVFVFPYDEVCPLPDAKRRMLWRSFLASLAPPTRTVIPFPVIPTRRVLLYPEDHGVLREALARVDIPAVFFPSFTLVRRGVDFYVRPYDVLVGACILIPSFREEPPLPIPQEVLETRRVVDLVHLPQVLGISPVRRKRLVVLVPAPHPYPEDWERIFALMSLPAQGMEVVVLAEDIFVAREGFEEAFRKARESGVIFEKLSLSRVTLSPSPDMRRIIVQYVPENDPIPVRLEAHFLVPVARKTLTLPPFETVFMSDREVSLEIPENPQFPPCATNIPGVFVARGDVADLVAAVTSYLREKRVAGEGRVVVDTDRCALCLTCLRSCPVGAIVLSGELKRCIAVNAALCVRCGVCAGLCPAKALRFEVVRGVLGHYRL